MAASTRGTDDVALALRVPEEKIYVRLEDLVIVAATGVELPSADLPMDVAGIEKVMAEDGLLQRFPRDAETPNAPDPKPFAISACPDRLRPSYSRRKGGSARSLPGLSSRGRP